MIRVKVKGDYDKTEKFLKKLPSKSYRATLEKYAQEGVLLLSSATPRDTGLTASSWGYEIVEKKDGSISIHWTNSNINDGVNIALIIQYGHGTRNGAYVEGIDYINPTMEPLFNDIVNNVWKEVTGQ